MERFKNIQAYIENVGDTREDMKERLLRTALDFGCRISHMDGFEQQETEDMFFVLYRFNELLDTVE